MLHIIVEREYDTPFDKKNWLEKDLKLLPCLEAHGVTWIRSQVSVDGQRTLCEFEAPDAESVRIASNETSISYQCVWVSKVIDPKVNFAEWVKKPHPGVSL